MDASWAKVVMSLIPALVTLGVVYGMMRSKLLTTEKRLDDLKDTLREDFVICKERLAAHSARLDSLGDGHSGLDKELALLNQKLDIIIEGLNK